MKLTDSRRLTGPNLLLEGAGAVLEVELDGENAEQLVKAWQTRARTVLEAVGWSDSTLLLQWFLYTWGREAEVDLRPGGVYRVAGVTPNGTEVEASGVFEDVDLPHRVSLSFTWSGSPDDPHSLIPEVWSTTITFEAAPSDGGARVTFRHAGLASKGSRDDHASAWRACLLQLVRISGE